MREKEGVSRTEDENLSLSLSLFLSLSLSLASISISLFRLPSGVALISLLSPSRVAVHSIIVAGTCRALRLLLSSLSSMSLRVSSSSSS